MVGSSKFSWPLPGEVLVPFVGPRFAFRLRLGKGAPNAKQTLLPVLDKKIFGHND